MAQKPTLPPQQFLVRCVKHCGEYGTDESTFRQYIDEALQRALDEKLRENSSRQFILTFKDGCPICAEYDPHRKVQLSTRKIPTVH